MLIEAHVFCASGGCTCEWQIDLQSARLGFERCEAYWRCLDHVQAVRLEHGREQAAHHADAGVVGVQGDVGCGPQVGNGWLHRRRSWVRASDERSKAEVRDAGVRGAGVREPPFPA